MSSVLLAMPCGVSAATLYFDPQDRTVGMDTPFKVAALIDAPTPVNAFDISVRVPKGLSVLGTEDGGSVINYWIDTPRFDDGTRVLHFSGIVPGGFMGAGARLVTIILKADTLGAVRIAIDQSSSVLRNDGKATAEPITSLPLSLRVERGRENSTNVIPDTEPPLPFSPEILSDSLIADGAPMLVFATQDAGSGVATYEVAESFSRVPEPTAWVSAESPYRINDTALSKWISVRAIDGAGNVRIETMPPSRFDTYAILLHRVFALFVLACLILIVYARMRPRSFS